MALVRSFLLAGLIATLAAANPYRVAQGTAADCAPSFLAMDPDGVGYTFSAVLTGGNGSPLWNRTWVYPTPGRCKEAHDVAEAIQRLLLIPTLTITRCQ